jgi:hypothetical protein
MSFRNSIVICVAIGVVAVFPSPAEDSATPPPEGLFSKWFGPKDGNSTPVPPRQRVSNPSIDPGSDTVPPVIRAEPLELQNRENDPMERFPEIPGYESVTKASQKDIEELIEQIYTAYEARIERMDPPDLRSSRTLEMGDVPAGFPTVWDGPVDDPLWNDGASTRRSLEDLYRQALEHSNILKTYRDLPLIRETGMQEADGDFDIETFIDGRINRRNEPIGSQLTTGNTATRFFEHEDYLEAGLRKRLSSGAQVTLSNRLATLSNNSAFLIPQNQGSSDLTLSVVQPLLQGGGYHYNHAKIKLAKIESRSASAEFVRQLDGHLLEVNNAYWALYQTRAHFLLTRDVVGTTAAILRQLEQRSDLDALQSEVLRARAALEMRKAMLNRAEMEARNSEERLRALVNDPGEEIGSNTELVPVTPPLLVRYLDDVRRVAKDALRNRPEVQQGFDALRAAIVRRDVHKNEKLPTLNLVADLMLGDIEARDRATVAFESQFGAGTGYMLGFQFTQPWDNDAERARLLRSEIELRQQASRLRAIVDIILLESLVTYRELMAAYRDLQGRHATLQASREELRQLRERLEIDTDDDRGRTTATQLQLILDSMDRNQIAEELFLQSIVAYNAAFARLHSARGTFLRRENVTIERVLDTDGTHPRQPVERLQLSKGSGETEAVPAVPEASATAVAKPERRRLFDRPTDSATDPAPPVPTPSVKKGTD